MKIYHLYLLLLALTAAFACCCLQLKSSPQAPPKLLAFFQAGKAVDTLLFEVRLDADLPTLGDTLPNAVFFKEIPAEMLAQIDYLADSTQALVLGRQYFRLNDSMAAYWVEIRQFWFQHHSLLLYNAKKHQFVDRVTVAEWYGGDGGQVLTGTWYFDYDGDGDKDLLRIDMQHSMTPGEEAPIERTETNASLLLWQKGRFVAAPLQDTASIIKAYPIQNGW